MTKVEQIEQRSVEDNNGRKLLLFRYYPEFKVFAYISNEAGYGLIKQSDIINK